MHAFTFLHTISDSSSVCLSFSPAVAIQNSLSNSTVCHSQLACLRGIYSIVLIISTAFCDQYIIYIYICMIFLPTLYETGLLIATHTYAACMGVHRYGIRGINTLCNVIMCYNLPLYFAHGKQSKTEQLAVKGLHGNIRLSYEYVQHN